MAQPFATVLLATLLALGAPRPSSALELEGMRLDESAEVGGRNLRLNGAGIGLRMVFKVYTISLYLPERRNSAESVLQNDEPRRLVIRMLRDVSGSEFRRAMLDSLDSLDPGSSAGSKQAIARGMLQIGTRLADQPSGLRKGDLLTLDWVPSVGTVVELNAKPMLAPIPDHGLYGALLNIWLGAGASDAGLRARLLGHLPERHASL